MPNTLEVTIDENLVVIIVDDGDGNDAFVMLQPDEAFILSVKLAQAAKAIVKAVLVPPKTRSDA